MLSFCLYLHKCLRLLIVCFTVFKSYSGWSIVLQLHFKAFSLFDRTCVAPFLGKDAWHTFFTTDMLVIFSLKTCSDCLNRTHSFCRKLMAYSWQPLGRNSFFSLDSLSLSR